MEGPGAQASNPIVTVASMGLTGIIAQIANLSAVALICVMFFFERNESRNVAKEDRAMFRESILQLSNDSRVNGANLRQDSDRQWRAIQKNSELIERSITHMENIIKLLGKDKPGGNELNE